MRPRVALCSAALIPAIALVIPAIALVIPAIALVIPAIALASEPGTGPALETGHGVDHRGIAWLTPVFNHQGQIGIVWLLINFVVLMWILEKLLFSKLRNRQREKHDVVRTELESATRAREEAEVVLAEYRGRLDRLDSETAELLADARARAEADRRRIIEEAEREAERIRAAAAAAAEREADYRRRQLEAEVIDRAVARAETLLRERITAHDQQRMVEAFAGQLHAVQLGVFGPSSPEGGAA